MPQINMTPAIVKIAITNAQKHLDEMADMLKVERPGSASVCRYDAAQLRNALAEIDRALALDPL